MKLLEDKILTDGKILEKGSILKVDTFLNHQIDYKILRAMGNEIYRMFHGEHITKILTIEASGIAIACMAGQNFEVPTVFAKKSQSKNIAGDVYSSKVMSFTHGREYDIMVAKHVLDSCDHILIVDDFLANGQALLGLCDIVRQSGAELVGCVVAIEKIFQKGGELVRSHGIRVEALAAIERMDENGIVFKQQS